MHWLELEGLKVPTRIGGHPALDFCNTWAGWGDRSDPRGEWLKTYDHLAVWAHHAELISLDDVRRLRRSAARDHEHAWRLLADARRLRTATHNAALDPSATHSLAIVTGQVRRSGAAIRLSAGANPSWSFPPDTGLDLPVLATAWSVGELLTRADLSRVKACPGDNCGWLFLDLSGRRTWCSMTSCGNRAKVSRYARRRRGGPR